VPVLGISTFHRTAGTTSFSAKVATSPRDQPMLTVHHLNNSRSQRVLWLLEELGVPYEIVRYQRQPDMRAPAELRAIHPLGKSPVITDKGNTIAESGAITEYVVDTYGDGRLIPPPKTPERLRYTYWLHYAEGSAMPPLLLKLLFKLMPRRAPALLRPLVRKVSNQALTTLVNPQLKQHMAFWESELGKSQWFAGDEFSAADIQMSFPLEAAAARGGLEQGHPKAMAFLERIHARPAYKRALEKGGQERGEGEESFPKRRDHCLPRLLNPADGRHHLHADAGWRHVVIGYKEIRRQWHRRIDAIRLEITHTARIKHLVVDAELPGKFTR